MKKYIVVINDTYSIECEAHNKSTSREVAKYCMKNWKETHDAAVINVTVSLVLEQNRYKPNVDGELILITVKQES